MTWHTWRCQKGFSQSRCIEQCASCFRVSPGTDWSYVRTCCQTQSDASSYPTRFRLSDILPTCVPIFFHFLFWRLFFIFFTLGTRCDVDSLDEYENISENISERSSSTRSRCLQREPRVSESHRATLPTISSRIKGITASVWFRQQGHARALRLPQLLAVYVSFKRLQSFWLGQTPFSF